MGPLLQIFKLILAAVICPIAFLARSPFLATFRSSFLVTVVAVSSVLIILEIAFLCRQKFRIKFIINCTILLIAASSLTAAISGEIKFHLTKQMVLQAKASQLEELGQHLIVGYRNFEEVKQLVTKKAIGGIFITTRNIKGKTKGEIQAEIETLQSIRLAQGLSPLWISTDWEGGIVSRLSPPLTVLPSLSAEISGDSNTNSQKDKVTRYARIQSRDLSALGINLNFAPVVDLNKGIINPKDKHSQIYKRAIAADKEVVTRVASWYCQNLEPVRCTLKHFPGLGRLETDTHLFEAELTASLAQLKADDWVPFREASKNNRPLIMLGHPKLMAVDRENPVSFSQQVVTGILRNDWQYDGILITDDFCMGAVYRSTAGFETGAVKAINAGVDLILIAFDPDLYYRAMSALLQARQKDNLDEDLLARSKMRLEKFKISW